MEDEYLGFTDFLLMDPIGTLLPIIIIVVGIGLIIWLTIRKIRIRLFQMKRYEDEMKAYKEWKKEKKRESKQSKKNRNG